MSISWIFRYLDCRLLMIVWYRQFRYPLLPARRLPPLADPSTPDPRDNEGFAQLTSHRTLSLYCLHKLLCFNTTVLIRGLSYNNKMTRTRWINNGSKNAVGNKKSMSNRETFHFDCRKRPQKGEMCRLIF